MSPATGSIDLRTRITGAAVDAGLAGGLALILTLAHGYDSQRYISYDSSGVSTGTTTHQSFSVPVFIVLTVVFWFALALLAFKDTYNRTPGQRVAGYHPRSSSGERLGIPALLWRQAFRAAAAPSAIVAVFQDRDPQPSHDALSKTHVEWSSGPQSTPRPRGAASARPRRPGPPPTAPAAAGWAPSGFTPETPPMPPPPFTPPAPRTPPASPARAEPDDRSGPTAQSPPQLGSKRVFKARPVKQLDVEILAAWSALSTIDLLTPDHQEHVRTTARSGISQAAVAAAVAGHAAAARDALDGAAARVPNSSAATIWPAMIDEARAALDRPHRR